MTVTHGVDDQLEELADLILAKDLNDNQRSPDRDIEKAAYRLGLKTIDDLKHYDPRNDWDTQDSAYSILMDPTDLHYVEPTICAEQDDGNVRAKNPALRERRALMRHVADEDAWAVPAEDVPLLGVNEGPRKTCTKCKRSRGVQFFSPDKRNQNGLRSWCRMCERESARNRYARKRT